MLKLFTVICLFVGGWTVGGWLTNSLAKVVCTYQAWKRHQHG